MTKLLKILFALSLMISLCAVSLPAQAMKSKQTATPVQEETVAAKKSVPIEKSNSSRGMQLLVLLKMLK